ncbi:MAG TPA: metallophosphoesterase [Burkholderiaceae bacterium]|nr:metallophosphoesterase [Burkholderiaceae bacterium]
MRDRLDIRNHAFVAPLFEGPIDIVGDVHGEIEALQNLLRALGYDSEGNHRDGRRLAFVGDLTDRGPDSIAVVCQVARLVQTGRAQCVAGNHELNLLRGAAKEGNGWFMHTDHDRARGKFHSSLAANDEHREQIGGFLRTLPLVLERPDLRVVHACWHGPSIERLRRAPEAEVIAAYRRFAMQSRDRLEATGMVEQCERERYDFAKKLLDPDAKIPFLAGIAAVQEAKQLSNPVRAVTSGLERPASEPFFSSGKWRMVERVLWWDHYEDDVPIIFGHYWRSPSAARPAELARGGRDLFSGTAFCQWLGPRENAFCVDFSVGRRFLEREAKLAVGVNTRLGAVRWPERELVFEDGLGHALS